MSIAWTRMPFRFASEQDFARQLGRWLGEVFYEQLPQAGYEVREEQIYLAFRIASALTDRRPILAEGGSGTGKTFAYLLPAVCYARLRGRPVVIATATPALQEQLASPQGDVAALSRVLGLDIALEVATAPEDGVCDIRAERWAARATDPEAVALQAWWRGSATGARREFPAASDRLWAEVAWNPSCRCDLCPRRGYCRLMKGRARVRAARDLIVCSHELLFTDAFGRERLPPGRLPVLPPVAAVVCDEGHRVAAVAQEAAGVGFEPTALDPVLQGCAGQGVRLRVVALVEAARQAAGRFAAAVEEATRPLPGEGRQAVERSGPLLAAAAQLADLLARLQDELAVEIGLYAESSYAEWLQGAQPLLDAAEATLHRLGDERGTILWRQGPLLWAAPRRLAPLWQRHFPGLPLVFTSATLASPEPATQRTTPFAYTAQALGLQDPLTARVGVPFRLAQQVLCYLPAADPLPADPAFWPAIARRLERLLTISGGRALVLLPDPASLEALRQAWRWSGPTRWEGQAAPQRLVEELRQLPGTVLVSHSLWEGIDVPGPALLVVAVPLLPLPGRDPRLQALRQDAAAAGLDPWRAVDLPEMSIRLRQGLGRLIRTPQDRGVLAVLDPRAASSRRWPELTAAAAACLPAGSRRVRTLIAVRRFLQPALPCARG